LETEQITFFKFKYSLLCKMIYTFPTPESQQSFYQQYHDKGPIVMLNMLRFRSEADYSRFTALDPGRPISGREAYKLYMAATAPLVEQAGGEVIYFGSASDFLIGPQHEKWDAVLLVRYASAETFISFAQSDDYRKTAGHRTAALEDSRLLPTAQPPI
jgi:uncharacterized protein (DUF1330 family)